MVLPPSRWQERAAQSMRIWETIPRALRGEGKIWAPGLKRLWTGYIVHLSLKAREAEKSVARELGLCTWLPAMGPWAISLPSLCLSYLVRKVRIIILSASKD